MLLLQLGELRTVLFLQHLALIARRHRQSLRLCILLLSCHFLHDRAPLRLAKLFDLLLFLIECFQHGLDLAILVLNDALEHRDLRLELAKDEKPAGRGIGWCRRQGSWSQYPFLALR